MYCRKCGIESGEGQRECGNCGAPLHSESSGPTTSNGTDLVTVLETGNRGIIAVAKSLLESAGIPYFTYGEAVHGLFTVGFIKIKVEAADADAAKILLTELDESEDV
jgi:Putative prokaryotic signal transducing protein